MKECKFHPDAFSEADAAAQFYEDQKSQLGKRFIEALTDTLNRISRDPQLYPIVKDNIRKCRILHFPYGVIYRERKNFIEVIAVMHFKRRPGYWKDRM